MQNAKKAMVMATAAMVANALGCQAAQAAEATDGAEALGDDGDKKKKPTPKKPPAKKVEKGKKRPVDFEPDFGMPAGTAYDVIELSDVP